MDFYLPCSTSPRRCSVVGFKFIFYKIEIYKNYWKIHKNITMILVELHLDVVLEVLLVLDLNFFLIKLADIYQWKMIGRLKNFWWLIYKWRRLILQQLKKSYRSFSYKKIHDRQNDRKGRYNWYRCIFFWKIAKQVKMKSQDPKKCTIFKRFQINLPKTTSF